MNKEQEAKFEKWNEVYTKSDDFYHNNTYKGDRKSAWCACLEANGIGEEPIKSMQSESYPKDNSAPEWVIDMIRTGKQVRCKVWDYEVRTMQKAVIGYLTNYPNPYFCDDGTAWKHAEPVTAWKPKGGEAVFVRTGRSDNIGQVISGDGETYKILRQDGTTERWALSSLKPFDASKIGSARNEI